MRRPNQRLKDSNWTFTSGEDGATYCWEAVQCALLMDLRDELKALNRVIGCPNFLAIPEILRAIRVNTRKPKRKKKLALVRSA